MARYFIECPKKGIETICVILTAQNAGKQIAGENQIGGFPFTNRRIVTRYVPSLYNQPKGLWGIVERWTYADRPELGEFGGEMLFWT
jgi:hypothetical protein